MFGAFHSNSKQSSTLNVWTLNITTFYFKCLENNNEIKWISGKECLPEEHLKWMLMLLRGTDLLKITLPLTLTILLKKMWLHIKLAWHRELTLQNPRFSKDNCFIGQ